MGVKKETGLSSFQAFVFVRFWAMNGSSVYYRPSALTFVLKADPGVGQCHIAHPSCSALHITFCAVLVVISFNHPFRTQVAFSMTSSWVLSDFSMIDRGGVLHPS